MDRKLIGKNSIVLAIGGSIAAPESGNSGFEQNLINLLEELKKGKYVFIVIGGGYPAKKAIKEAREKGITDNQALDMIGIEKTKFNAKRLAKLLRASKILVNTDIPHTTDNAVRLSKHYRVVIMGGTTPGHSTDFVAAELAKKIGCALVIATNVNGVFDKDPKKHKDAKPLSRLTFNELFQTIGDPEWAAGAPGVIDGPATRLIVANQIRTSVLNGNNFANLLDAVNNRKFEGTLIHEETAIVI